MDCKAYNEFRCRSCQYLDRSYEASLKAKEEHLFSLFPKETLHSYLPPFSVLQTENSRNKAKLAVASVNNEISFGIYNRDQIFSLVEDCPLYLEGINDFLKFIKNELKVYKITPYDLKSKTGELKYLILTMSESTKELLCRFVVRSKESIDRLKLMAQNLEKNNPKLAMTVNIQPNHSAVLEGDEEIYLTNKHTIIHQYNHLQLELGPKSFFQVTSFVAQNLYQSIANFVAEKKIESMLDLYCGVGAFSLYCAPFVKRATGVEISSAAIELAKINATRNQFSHLQYFSTDVNQIWEKLNNETFELILVNPPRSGVGEKSIRQVLDKKPQYIVYSSCNAETLFQDFQVIKDRYHIISVQIFDMFPLTSHYETLMIFSKSN